LKSFAFVFPGQGSQSPGMLEPWNGHPAVALTLAEASDALGEDVAQLIREGSKETLSLTTNTQPVMLVAGVAAWRAWVADGGAEPALLAGHSLGEYSALVAASVLSLADALALVRFRAQAMQDAVPVGVGAMAAILGMESESVVQHCREVSRGFAQDACEIVEAVNFNDPQQTVIAGSKLAVERACEVLKAAGAKRALILPVSAPFHSSLMRPAAEKLRERLANVSFARPRIPVVNNVDVAFPDDASGWRDALFRQAFMPVRWVECMQAIRTRGVEIVVECGPGKVLAGLAKRIVPDMVGVSLSSMQTMNDVKEILV
jgi:[acyl-carrier-protein] S-malonyltransferase